MTSLRAIWSSLALVRFSRQEPKTIAEMRKASLGKLAWRTPTRTYEADPAKLQCSRARGKLRNVAEWSQRYDDRRKVS